MVEMYVVIGAPRDAEKVDHPAKEQPSWVDNFSRMLESANNGLQLTPLVPCPLLEHT